MARTGDAEKDVQDHRQTGVVALFGSGVLVAAGVLTDGWEIAIVLGAIVAVPAWWMLMVAAVARGVALGHRLEDERRENERQENERRRAADD